LVCEGFDACVLRMLSDRFAEFKVTAAERIDECELEYTLVVRCDFVELGDCFSQKIFEASG